MLHVLLLTASSQKKEVVSRLLPAEVRLSKAPPSAAPGSPPDPDVCLFDLGLGLPALRRWMGRAEPPAPVVALITTGRREERKQALKKGISDVLVWEDLNSTCLLSALQEAARPETLENRPYEALFRENRLIQWLVEPRAGRIVDANRAAAQFYQYEPRHLAQLRIADVNELPTRAIARKMRRAVREERNRFSFWHQTATGEKKRVKVWSYPIQTPHGLLLFSTICPAEPEEAGPKDDATVLLSPRELEVFHLLIEGKTITEIKEGLFLSRGTVKNYLSRIYGKLEVADRAEAIYWAAKRGYIR